MKKQLLHIINEFIKGVHKDAIKDYKKAAFQSVFLGDLYKKINQTQNDQEVKHVFQTEISDAYAAWFTAEDDDTQKEVAYDLLTNINQTLQNI